MIGMIWAQARGGVIGEAGDMPWRLPEDMARFKAITMGHPVVMGRRTWESFPERFRPLPGRDNIVITSDHEYVAPGARIARTLDDALDAASAIDDEVWIVGGGRVYRDAMARADRLEITDIDLSVDGDTTAPDPAADDTDADDTDASWREVARDPAEGWHVSRTGLRFAYRSLERSPRP
jgi:dihydrofolate reductase